MDPAPATLLAQTEQLQAVAADLESVPARRELLPPFELLVEIERRARLAVAGREGRDGRGDEWVGVGFRLGSEKFVAERSDVREILPLPEPVVRVPGPSPGFGGSPTFEVSY